MPSVNGLKVEVRSARSGRAWGLLTWSDAGPKVILDTGDIIEDAQRASLVVREEVIVERPGASEIHPLPKPVFVRLQPIIMVRKGYEDRIVAAIDDMYPPSSHHWKSRLIEDRHDTLFVVQPVEGTDSYWLTIVDPDTGTIRESHALRTYELGALSMQEDWESFRLMEFAQAQKSPEQTRDQALKVLDGPAPSWKAIANLTQGVVIPGLRRGRIMRDLTEQLVPLSFPKEIREEMMVFLAWMTKNRIPKEDPVDFFQGFAGFSLLGELMIGHTQCRIDGVSPPEYVSIMRQAELGRLNTPRRALPESIRGSPWLVAWYKISEQFPNWLDRAIDHATKLNTAGTIQTRLPVSRSEARASVRAWGDRLALLSHGLLLRAHIYPNALGLHNLVYVGPAHRWPHRHLALTARLGFASERPPYVHMMVMPPSAVERVLRARPNVVETEWSAKNMNLGLYDAKRKEWRVASTRILNSMSEARSLRRLQNEFGAWQGVSPQQPTATEAKVLDLASRHMYLALFEQEKYLRSFGIDRRTLENTLCSLRDRGIIRLHYGVIPEGVTSIFTMAHGPPDSICSVARAFLIHTPTASVEIGEAGGICFILSRVPEKSARALATSLEERAPECGIELRCMRVTSYRGYMDSLYQRLLKEDGTWDDDVSALLSQIRPRTSTADGEHDL